MHVRQIYGCGVVSCLVCLYTRRARCMYTYDVQPVGLDQAGGGILLIYLTLSGLGIANTGGRGGIHEEVSEIWEEWGEGQRGKGSVSGNVPQKRGGLGRGGEERERGGVQAGRGCGAKGTQGREGGRGGGGNNRGLERGGEHRDRSSSDRGPPGGRHTRLDQNIQRGISVIRDQVEKGCQVHLGDQVSRSVLQTSAQPVAQPPNDITPHLPSSQSSLILTTLHMNLSDDQALHACLSL